MCIYSTGSSDCDCPQSSGGLLSHLEHHNAQEAEKSTNAYDIDFTPAAALFLSSAGQPGFCASDQSLGGTNDPPNIHQPPPNVIDYWFDLLGLSFDPAPSEDSSNLTRCLAKSQLAEDANDVSPLLVIMCFTIPFGSAYNLREMLIYFEYSRLLDP